MELLTEGHFIANATVCGLTPRLETVLIVGVAAIVTVVAISVRKASKAYYSSGYTVHHRRSALVHTIDVIAGIVTRRCGFFTKHDKPAAVTPISFDQASWMYAD